MKTKILFIALSIFFIHFGVYADNDFIGAKAAAMKSNPSIEEMLIYAIQDEYLARAEYELIIDRFGPARPFTNIIKSEETHISMLEPLFDKYDYQLPSDISKEHITIPQSLKSAFETGVEAEIDNIKMYEKFLTAKLPDDIRDTFERLKKASGNHLRAFQRGLSRYN
jgi:hypothetical protein